MALGWALPLAQLAVGGYGIYQAEQARKDAKDVVKESEKRQDKLAYQDTAWREQWIEPLYKHFLGGGRAGDLDIPGFSEQFQEIDYGVANQMRQLSTQSKEAQQVVADNMTGGAKIRALAQIARTTADNKARIVGEGAQKRRDLDIALTNEWTKKATDYRSGVDPNVQYSGEQKDIESALGAYGSSQRDLNAILESLGSMYGSRQSPSTPTGKAVPPTSTSRPPSMTDLYNDPLTDSWLKKDIRSGEI